MNVISQVRQIFRDRKAGRNWAEEQMNNLSAELPEIIDPEVVALRAYVIERWTKGEIHGIEHWDRVFRNGQLLLSDGVNERVVQRFAYLHDFCRLDDGEDFEHGERAAEWMLEIRDTLLSSMTDEEFHLLQDACRFHTKVERTGDRTVDACFDADRLDLGRVGLTPLPSRMATEKGRELALMVTPV